MSAKRPGNNGGRPFTPPSQRRRAVSQRAHAGETLLLDGNWPASAPKPAPAPAPLLDTRSMHGVGNKSMLWRHKGKFALGGGAAAGGTAFLYRHHNKEKTVAKYFDPFSGDTVEFTEVGKAAETLRYAATSTWKKTSGRTKGLVVGGGLAGAAVGSEAAGTRRGRAGTSPNRMGGSFYNAGYARGSRQRLKNGGVAKFASNAMANQPMSLVRVKPGHTRFNANQVAAQRLQVFHGKNLTLKTSSPLHHVHR